MAYQGNVPAEAYTTTVKDTFNGNGSTTAFTLSLPTVTNDIRVVVENVVQEPTAAYSVSGTTLTFTAAPPSGTGNVYVVHLGPAVQTVEPPSTIAGATTFASTVSAQSDLLFPDNSKAIFGAGSDLQIYHDGSNSYIDDTGAGDMLIRGSARILLRKAGTTENMIRAEADSYVKLYFDDAEKLATTATGIDVTGTVASGAGTALLPSITTTGDLNTGMWFPAADTIAFSEGGVEALRIDSSGNVLVGMTTASTDNNGVGLRADGLIHGKRADVVANFNRQTSEGVVVELAKDNTVKGRIGVQGDSLWISSATSMGIYIWDAGALLSCDTAGNASDNLRDIGHGSYRWRTIYAGTGSINTSDRTEKQDIDVMSEAETRVAVACKGLMRKFRFIDAVEAKGDDARIHFGIIAQDLQDAFAAEGLDASRYAMFCSDTWWEADRVVPAVEAVDATLDDEGNQITEAVVAVAEHTVTDKFMTLEKAPEGATERTRLGVRYSELLAFIIGAL
jgi:hypothetical protein